MNQDNIRVKSDLYCWSLLFIILLARENSYNIIWNWENRKWKVNKDLNLTTKRNKRKKVSRMRNRWFLFCNFSDSPKDLTICCWLWELSLLWWLAAAFPGSLIFGARSSILSSLRTTLKLDLITPSIIETFFSIWDLGLWLLLGYPLPPGPSWVKKWQLDVGRLTWRACSGKTSDG